MGTLFARPAAPHAGGVSVSAHDRAVLDLKVQRDKLRKFQKQMESALETDKEMARRALRDNKKAMVRGEKGVFEGRKGVFSMCRQCSPMQPSNGATVPSPLLLCRQSVCWREESTDRVCWRRRKGRYWSLKRWYVWDGGGAEVLLAVATEASTPVFRLVLV